MLRHVFRSTLLIAVAIGLAACGRGGGPPSPAAPAAPEPYPAPQRLYYDNGGGIRDSVRLVVRDEEGFRTRWEQATSRQGSPPPPPALDFSREMAVVVGAGRMTTEDQIRVDSANVVRRPDDAGRTVSVLVVHVRTIRGCRQFNVDAWPLEILRFRRFDGGVQFQESTSDADGCSTTP